MAGRRKPISTSGLTLVEILVALVILAVVLLPVIAAFSQALVTTSQSSISSAASSIGREKVEALKRLDYSYLQSQARETKAFGNHPGFFEVEVTVTVVRDDARAGLKRAAVSVYRAGSLSPVVTLTSYLAVRGV